MATARVENARRMLDEAAARDRAKRGVAAGKENATTKTDGAPVKTNDVVARAGVVKGGTEVKILGERLNGLSVRSDEETKTGTAREDADAEDALEAHVADIVRDWLGDFDSVTAELDRVCGENLQTLYAPLRGDERLEKLRVDKSALKRRLRRFDLRIAHTCGRKTTKQDKSHLRPLYIRLAKIKDLIAIREAGG